MVLAGIAAARAGSFDGPWSSGGWSGVALKSPPPSKIQLSGDEIHLLSDFNATFAIHSLSASKGNGTVTLDVGPVTAARGHTITLGGPLDIGTYTTVAFTSSSGYRVALPTVTSDKAGPKLAPDSAAIDVASLAGNVTLAGTNTGSTLGLFTGTYLEIDSGTWTLTGNNSKATWNAGINGGKLVLARGASLSSGSISITGTLAPASGATVVNYLGFHDGSTLDLTDGKIGTFTSSGVFSGPNGGSIHLKLDVSADGVDQILLTKTSNTNDIRDYLELNVLSDKLTPGTYKVMTVAEGSLVENHLGFDFTGDPADHDHIVRTKTIGAYTFTLDTLDGSGKSTNYRGDYPAYTLTIAPAAK